MNGPSNTVDPRLAPTLAPLGDHPRRAMEEIAAMGFRRVQLSATQPGLRPRELDQSARRDLAATLRRRELEAAGLDLWIPPRHFADPARVDHAVAAVKAAMDLAGTLHAPAVSLTLPGDGVSAEVVRALTEAADRSGVRLANHGFPLHEGPDDAPLAVGVDPAVVLGAGQDPAQIVLEHSARLAAVRLCDLTSSGQRGPIGDHAEGQLDVLAYKAALAGSGFAGSVVVDARQWVDVRGGLLQSAQAWQVIS